MYIAINQKNMSKYREFFKEFHNLTNVTRHRPVNVAQLAKKHKVHRVIMPRAIELNLISKTGDRATSKYKWIGQYPDPIVVRKVLEHSLKVYNQSISSDKVTSSIPEPKVNTELVGLPIYRTSDDNALEIVEKLRAEGKSNEEIGKLFGITNSAVSKLVKRKRAERDKNSNKPCETKKQLLNETTTTAPAVNLLSDAQVEELAAKINLPIVVETPKAKKKTVKKVEETIIKEKKVKFFWGLWSYSEKVTEK